MDPITIIILGGAGVLVYFLAKGNKQASANSTVNDVCSTCPSSMTGTSVQLLKSSNSPAGDVSYPSHVPAPPAPTNRIIYSQNRIRPDGPMLIYPVSNVGQGVTSQLRAAGRATFQHG